MRAKIAVLGLVLLSAPAFAKHKRRHPAPPPARPKVIVFPASSNVPLFPDELEAVRGAAMTFLAAQKQPPMTLIPLADVDAVRALTLSGTAKAGGPKCAVAPSFASLLGRAFPDAQVVWVNAGCAGKRCRLELAVGDSPLLHPSGQTIARWEAKVASADRGEPAAWLAAAASLAPPHPAADDNEQDGPPGHVGPPGSRVQVVGFRPAGPWVPALDPNVLDGDAAALDACHVDAATLFMDLATLSVDEGGQVERCAMAPLAAIDDPVDPAREKCLCAALAGHRFPAGQAGRRLRLTLSDQSSFDSHADVKLEGLHAPDPATASAALERVTPELKKCAHGSYPVRIEIDPIGRVTKVSPTTDACVGAAVGKIALPCTSDGKSAKIDLTVVIGGPQVVD